MTDLKRLGFEAGTGQARYPKILVFGAAGTGKTWFALGAGTKDNPAIVLDTEAGTHFYGPETGHHFLRKDTQNIRDALQVVQALEGVESDAPLVLDSGTILYEAVQEAVAEKARVDELKFHHWRHIKRPFRKLYVHLMNLPRPVIITAHEAQQFSMSKGELVVTGYDPRFEKQAVHVFDLVLRLTRNGEVTTATVHKSRLAGFPTGKTIENPSYHGIIKAAYGGKTFVSGDVLDGDAEIAKVAEAMDAEGRLMADKDDVLAKVSAAKAVPHLENIFRKYKSDAEAGGWLDDLVAACSKRKKELKGGE